MASSGHPGRVAIIDIGTNTVRLLVADNGPDGHSIRDEFGEVTSLGAGLIRTGRIRPDDIPASKACLVEAVRRARAAGAEILEIVGTEVFRRASNGPDVVRALSNRVGYPIQVLSAEEEGDASYLGAVAWPVPSAEGAMAVLDVGGGSTELIRGIGAVRKTSRSLPFGALVVTDRWLANDPSGHAAANAAGAFLAAELSSLLPGDAGLADSERLLAVGGSACALAAWVHGIRHFDADRVHGLAVSQVALQVAIGQLAELSLAQRMVRGGLGSGRARVLLGGSILLAAALQATGRDGFETSVFGLRHGRALVRFHGTL